MQSGYRGTLERYMPMDPDKREKQKKSERLGQDPKLCNKQIISQDSKRSELKVNMNEFKLQYVEVLHRSGQLETRIGNR